MSVSIAEITYFCLFQENLKHFVATLKPLSDYSTLCPSTVLVSIGFLFSFRLWLSWLLT